MFSATHYEELTKLAHYHPSIRNGCMAIREEDKDIHFLYLLKQGSANKSYGIQVARLAGLPQPVVDRAQKLLCQHESSKEKENITETKNKKNMGFLYKTNKQLPIQFIMKEILEYSLMTQTPINAMNQIQKWQNILKQQKTSKVLKTKTQSLSDQESFLDILN